MKIFRIYIISLGILLSVLSQQSFGQSAQNETLKYFIAGNLDYKDENYAKAVENYEHIIHEGWASGSVYYNLGSSYFRNGQPGKAILNYERAKRLLPRDSDLSFNYNYVRNSLKPYGGESDANLFMRFFENMSEFYSLGESVWLATWCVVLMGFGYLISLFLKWPQGIRRGVSGVFAVVAVFYAMIVVTKISYEKNLAVVVTNTETKFEPREDSTVHFQLPEGAKVQILKHEGDWAKVKRLDGKLGWLHLSTVEEI